MFGLSVASRIALRMSSLAFARKLSCAFLRGFRLKSSEHKTHDVTSTGFSHGLFALKALWAFAVAPMLVALMCANMSCGGILCFVSVLLQSGGSVFLVQL